MAPLIKFFFLHVVPSITLPSQAVEGDQMISNGGATRKASITGATVLESFSHTWIRLDETLVAPH